MSGMQNLTNLGINGSPLNNLIVGSTTNIVPDNTIFLQVLANCIVVNSSKFSIIANG